METARTPVIVSTLASKAAKGKQRRRSPRLTPPPLPPKTVFIKAMYNYRNAG